MSLKPEVFGKFILLDKLAAGGMAEVYRAKVPGHGGIGKIIALKRILPQYSANSEFIDMFKNEAKIAINLTQANIAQIYEFGEEGRLFYLAMEFIDGRNLRQIISRCTKQQKSLTIEQCVYVIAQICLGLDYAHRCTDKNSGQLLNIIHRDMSPQNIMISFEGEVKMVDFGIAKAESRIESTKAGTLKGKFGYMSPEQAEGQELDWRTDIFSTGIVLWELLTGERLFVANNELNTIKKIRECQVPSPKKVNPHINEELDRITMKALARDKNLRYQSASEMSKDLSRYLYKINPEFTAQDLSHFTKFLFKEEILEDRNKVSEFAKIDFQMLQQNDKSLGDGTTTVTRTETDSEPPMQVKTNNRPPDNLVMQTSGKDIAFHVDPNKLRQQLASAKSKRAAIQNSYNDELKYWDSSKRKNLITAWASPVLLGIVLLAFGYIVFKNPVSLFKWGSDMASKISPEKVKEASIAPAPVQQAQPIMTPALIQMTHLTIRSFPAGAEVVMIDDETKEPKPMGNTPLEVTLPSKKKYRFVLTRTGYKLSKEYIPTRPVEDLSMTLERVLYGYVNIDVKPAGSDIYIDDQKIDSTAPLRRIAIPAGRPVKITAVNHYTGFRDEQIVTIKQDTLKNINLFPRQKR